MALTFSMNRPTNFQRDPILISGSGSLPYQGKIYLCHFEDSKMVNVYEIRHEYHVRSFVEAVLIGNSLVVGYEGHLYIYDIYLQRSLLVQGMQGYFGYLSVVNELIYVTDAQGIYCIDPLGQVRWVRSALGLDGVVILAITAAQIIGSGEWDPPGGWIDFTIDVHTGQDIGQKRTVQVR